MQTRPYVGSYFDHQNISEHLATSSACIFSAPIAQVASSGALTKPEYRLPPHSDVTRTHTSNTP